MKYEDTRSIDVRFQEIEDRLTKVESCLGISSVNVNQDQNFQDLENVRKSSKDTTFTKASSINWLAILASICFIAAAGFIIQVSIESNFFTPNLQVVLSGVLGITLIGIGLLMMRFDIKYSAYLPASGIVVLFLTALAANVYYPILSTHESIVGITIVSAVSIGLYYYVREEVFAQVAIIGAYLSPLILNIFKSSEIIVAYFCIYTITFAILGVLFKSRTIWIVLTYISLLATGIVGTIIKIDITLMSAIAAQFAVCMVGIIIYVIKYKTSLNSTKVWLYFPAILIFSIIEIHYMSRLNSNLLPWMGIGFALISSVVYLGIKYKIKDSGEAQGMLLTTAMLGIFYSWYLNLFPGNLDDWILPVLVVGYLLFNKMSNLINSNTYKPFRVAIFIVKAIFVFQYFKLVLGSAWAVNRGFDLNKIAASIISAAALWSIVLLRKSLSSGLLKNETFLLGITHVLTIKTLYNLVEQFGSLAVSSVWLSYSIAVICFAFAKLDKTMARSSMLILVLAAGKALLYDASFAPTNIRIICLLITGIVLYGAGYMMRRISTWKVEPQL
jgi:uncharacterized membrane protein